jgi:hypothetical protein
MGSIPQHLQPAHGHHSRAFLSRKLALHGWNRPAKNFSYSVRDKLGLRWSELTDSLS